MRSFYHDDEFNLLIDDPKLAGLIADWIETNRQSAHTIKLSSWRRRPLSLKLRQAISSLGRYLF
jgi:phosphatidylserine/phosphatidylglycerophosphate/cardiolipin synthase-like enzyme